MLKKEDFITYFNGLSNIEQLKVIEEKEKYLPDAIEAANEILAKRNHSVEELSAAQSEINFLANKKKEQKEKLEKTKSHIDDFIDEHFGLKERSPEKLLNLFSAGLFLYTLISDIFNIRLLAAYYSSSFATWLRPSCFIYFSC